MSRPIKELAALPLDMKIRYAQVKIQEWYETWNGNVHVSFSGGKDSTLLLRLVRNIYPEVPAVFCNTGQEHPELVKFVKTIENVVWLPPAKPFLEVVEKHGYPLVSKEVAMGFSRLRNTKSEVQRQLRMHGGVNPTSGRVQTVGVIPKKVSLPARCSVQDQRRLLLLPEKATL